MLVSRLWLAAALLLGAAACSVHAAVLNTSYVCDNELSAGAPQGIAVSASSGTVFEDKTVVHTQPEFSYALTVKHPDNLVGLYLASDRSGLKQSCPAAAEFVSVAKADLVADGPANETNFALGKVTATTKLSVVYELSAGTVKRFDVELRHVPDRLALLGLLDSGVSFSESASWDATKSHCDSLWDGVVCGANDVVESLTLTNLSEVPDLRSVLASLTSLLLVNVDATADFNAEKLDRLGLGNKPALRTFSAKAAKMYGYIRPNVLLSLTTLTTLDLSDNYLVGNAPNTSALTNAWLKQQPNFLFTCPLDTATNQDLAVTECSPCPAPIKATHTEPPTEFSIGPYPAASINANITFDCADNYRTAANNSGYFVTCTATKTLKCADTSECKCLLVGCDGLPGSGKKLDTCNVCGGNGQSCLPSKVVGTIVLVDVPLATVLSKQTQLVAALAQVFNVSASKVKITSATDASAAGVTLTRVEFAITTTKGEADALVVTVKAAGAKSNTTSSSPLNDKLLVLFPSLASVTLQGVKESSASESSGGGGLGLPVIIGIAAGGAVLLIVLLYCCCIRSGSSESSSSPSKLRNIGQSQRSKEWKQMMRQSSVVKLSESDVAALTFANGTLGRGISGYSASSLSGQPLMMVERSGGDWGMDDLELEGKKDLLGETSDFDAAAAASNGQVLTMDDGDEGSTDDWGAPPELPAKTGGDEPEEEEEEFSVPSSRPVDASYLLLDATDTSTADTAPDQELRGQPTHLPGAVMQLDDVPTTDAYADTDDGFGFGFGGGTIGGGVQDPGTPTLADIDGFGFGDDSNSTATDNFSRQGSTFDGFPRGESSSETPPLSRTASSLPETIPEPERSPRQPTPEPEPEPEPVPEPARPSWMSQAAASPQSSPLASSSPKKSWETPSTPSTPSTSWSNPTTPAAAESAARPQRSFGASRAPAPEPAPEPEPQTPSSPVDDTAARLASKKKPVWPPPGGAPTSPATATPTSTSATAAAPATAAPAVQQRVPALSVSGAPEQYGNQEVVNKEAAKPKLVHPRTWSSIEVITWLKHHGFKDFVDTFYNNGFEGKHLIALTVGSFSGMRKHSQDRVIELISAIQGLKRAGGWTPPANEPEDDAVDTPTSPVPQESFQPQQQQQQPQFCESCYAQPVNVRCNGACNKSYCDGCSERIHGSLVGAALLPHQIVVLSSGIKRNAMRRSMGQAPSAGLNARPPSTSKLSSFPRDTRLNSSAGGLRPESVAEVGRLSSTASSNSGGGGGGGGRRRRSSSATGSAIYATAMPDDSEDKEKSRIAYFLTIDITREDCNRLLRPEDGLNGIYILRRSKTRQASYVLSMTYNHKVQHFQVQYDRGMYVTQIGHSFRTLEDAVLHFKKQSRDGLPCRLIHACRLYDDRLPPPEEIGSDYEAITPTQKQMQDFRGLKYEDTSQFQKPKKKPYENHVVIEQQERERGMRSNTMF